MAKVKAGISRQTSEGVVEKGRTIVTKMTLNPDYPDQQALLPAITTACNNAAAANQAADFNGGKLEHDVKRNCDKVLRQLIMALVPQVQTASGGDSTKIIGAGFDVAKTPQPSPVPAEPQEFQALYTPFEGAIKLRWTVEKVAKYYQLQLEYEGKWEMVATTTRSNHTINGLESGKLYTLRVIAVGAAGAGPASESINVKAA